MSIQSFLNAVYWETLRPSDFCVLQASCPEQPGVILGLFFH